MLVPTQCGGKLSVRQTTVLSSDCSSLRSNGSGATANPTVTSSPTVSEASACVVQKPLIPSVVFTASSTVAGGASTSNWNSTSGMVVSSHLSGGQKRTIHFAVG